MYKPYRRIFLAARNAYWHSRAPLQLAVEAAADAAFTAAQRSGFSRLDLRRLADTAAWQATGIAPGDFVARGMM